MDRILTRLSRIPPAIFWGTWCLITIGLLFVLYLIIFWD